MCTVAAATAHPGCATHGLGHLLVAPEGLYPEADGLELRPHLVELLDVSPGSDEVLGHDLACVLGGELSSGWSEGGEWAHHLARLCTLLDVHDELLLLLLELCALAVELALGLCEGALVLAEPLRGGDRAAKERLLRCA